HSRQPHPPPPPARPLHPPRPTTPPRPPYTTLFRSTARTTAAARTPACGSLRRRTIRIPAATMRFLASRAMRARSGSRRARRRTKIEEHTSELQSRENLVCRLLLEKKQQLLRGGRGA